MFTFCAFTLLMPANVIRQANSVVVLINPLVFLLLFFNFFIFLQK